MNKTWKQDNDWHLWTHDNQYVGEVFGEDDYQIRIKIVDPNLVPETLKRQLEFGFASVDNNGYYVLPKTEYYNMVALDN